jgi:hypothetical protein
MSIILLGNGSKMGMKQFRKVGLTVIDTIKDDVFSENIEHILAITKHIFC